MTVAVNDNVTFTYEKIDGEVKTVENLHVDRVFTSSEGHRIVQGWLEATGEGRAYRQDGISNVVVL
jgi:hypothetical protein